MIQYLLYRGSGMTNEEFILALNVMRIAVSEKDLPTVTRLIEHAQKLVAIVESSEDVAANPHNNFDKILILRGKLQDLKRE
jgi:hypothetical protein